MFIKFGVNNNIIKKFSSIKKEYAIYIYCKRLVLYSSIISNFDLWLF